MPQEAGQMRLQTAGRIRRRGQGSTQLINRVKTRRDRGCCFEKPLQLESRKNSPTKVNVAKTAPATSSYSPMRPCLPPDGESHDREDKEDGNRADVDHNLHNRQKARVEQV